MDTEDKRHFKRYYKVSELGLKKRKGTFKAKMVDYSLDGIGAALESNSNMEKGDVISFTVDDMEIESLGEVVWIKNHEAGTRIGVKKLGLMKGHLKDFWLADTMIGLQRSMKTGILTVQSGDVIKMVYIKNGDMIFSASNQDEDRLGNMLLRDNIITLDQFNQSVVEMKKTGLRQGAALVKLGHLAPEGLITAVRHYVERIIESLFILDDGRFVFEEKPLPSEEVITLKLSAGNIIYYGVKGINSEQRIEKGLPPLDGALCFSSAPLDIFQDVKLDQSGKRIISCIDGKTTITEILSITQMDRLEAFRTIYALLSIRMIRALDVCKLFQFEQEKIKEEIMTERTEAEIDPDIREKIEVMYRRHEDIGYYGVLGVKNHATTEEIKKAYYKAAKKFHPDMHFYNTDDSLKMKLSEIFTYIYEAYSTLSHPHKRKEYDAGITIKPAKLTANQDRARAQFGEGMIQFKGNNYAEAELCFGQAAYFDSTIAEYHYYYGLALVGLKKYKEAEKAFSRALRLEPYNADYLCNLGFVFLALGFPVRARGLFEKALRTNPAHVKALEGLDRSSPAV